MFQLERREQIVQRLVRDGRVDVTELAGAFDVTSETISGTSRTSSAATRPPGHGGTIPWRGASLVPRLEVRVHQRVREAALAAAAAASA
jgi:hypothetical protein